MPPKDDDIQAFQSLSRLKSYLMLFVILSVPLMILLGLPILAKMVGLKNGLWLFPMLFALLTLAMYVASHFPSFRGFVWLYSRGGRSPRDHVVWGIILTILFALFAALLTFVNA